MVSPQAAAGAVVVTVSLLALGVLGALSAWGGGAGMYRAVARVVFWGALAMAATALAGRLFGAVG